MLAMNVTELTQTEWASPMVLVLNKDGTLRFCVNYKNLNAVTKPDLYLILHMGECIDSLHDATILSTLQGN